ncbi:MAG TPA: ubiquinone-dependent pyruvate dehydrogenase [Baekduia sp.]
MASERLTRPRRGTIADQMVEVLKASGVQRVHGLPGDSLNGLTDALRRDGDIAWRHVRHEEAAAFAACGEAQVTGELAVCAASCGPGNLHLVNGLFDAQRSRVPVLALAAHIPRVEVGGAYFQETHPQELFRECSVYCEMVSIPEQLPRLLEIAMRAAVERQGVAVLVIPGEVFLSERTDGPAPRPIRRAGTSARPSDDALDTAAGVLNAAEKVTILAGIGCAGAHAEVVALAGALRAPVVHTLRGKDAVEFDNPYDVGMTGLLGFSSGYRAMEHCDALLILGADFPYREFYPEGVPIVQVDVRGEAIGRRMPVDVPLVGTVAATAPALTQRIGPDRDEAHLRRMTDHYTRARKKLDALADEDSRATPMHPQLVAATLNRLATDDAVFLADVGTPVIWAARYLHMNGRRRLLGSFVHGTMANALPQALGVQAAYPERQVITLSGDGGLAMLLGELITLHQQRLPVKVITFNNSALAFVELEMKAVGLVNFGTDLENPDFGAVARAIGLHGVRIEDPAQLEEGLRTALAHDGPAVVDVVTARQELSIPPHISARQAGGFALWATRSVLSGRGDHIVELARTNLRQLETE